MSKCPNVQGTAGQTYAVQEWAKVLELQSTNDCANHCTYMGRWPLLDI